MGIISRLLYLYLALTLISLIAWAILPRNKEAAGEPNTVLNIKFLKNETYTLLDLVRDENLLALFKPQRKNSVFLSLFFITFFLTFFFRLLIMIITLCFILYYLILFVKLKFFNNHKEYKLYKTDFYTPLQSNIIDLFIFLFYKKPKWHGFTIAYFCAKNLSTPTKKNIDIADIFHKFTIFFTLGISGFLLVFTVKITQDFVEAYYEDRLTLDYIISIIVFNLKAIFNQTFEISQQLRVYNENGKLIFNPPKFTQSFFLKPHKIASPTEDNKIFYHPGLAMQPSWTKSQTNLDVQLTGTPPSDAEYIKAATLGYKEKTSAIIFNTYRDPQNIHGLWRPNLYQNLGITDHAKFMDFVTIIFANRIYRNNIKVVYEGQTFKDKLIKEKSNFIKTLLDDRRTVLDNKTLAFYSNIRNSMEKDSKQVVIAIEELLIEKNYLNYHRDIDIWKNHPDVRRYLHNKYYNVIKNYYENY